MTANLLTATCQEFADVMRRALLLGVVDATGENKVKDGMEIVRSLGVTEYRNGHVRALKAAYMAGRFHVETMGQET